MSLINRKINLFQAVSINAIDMVGIGPFVVMPFVVHQFGNGLFLWAWIFGAFTAFIDSTIWCELGAKYPLAGGTYQFHKIAFGVKGGKLMSFLYVWQTLIQAPLVVASAAIGFSQYLTYLLPLEIWQQKLVSGSIVLLVFVLLYRKIENIGKMAAAMGVVVVLTIAWIIIAGLTHKQHELSIVPKQYSDFFSMAFWAAIGQGSVKTVYSYLGYYNVCHLGGEIKTPERNIPRSMFLSILVITILYLLMNYAVMGVVDPSSVNPDNKYLVSSFMEQIAGHSAGVIITILILAVAFFSLFAVVLGYSRVPYAAAADGNFFSSFAKVHADKKIPYVSLTVLCVLGFFFSLLFKLTDVISSILAMRIVVQFMGQAVGLVLIRKSSNGQMPFRMFAYPIPVILSLIIWAFLFYSTGKFAIGGIGIMLLGIIVYQVSKKLKRS